MYNSSLGRANFSERHVGRRVDSRGPSHILHLSSVSLSLHDQQQCWSTAAAVIAAVARSGGLMDRSPANWRSQIASSHVVLHGCSNCERRRRRRRIRRRRHRRNPALLASGNEILFVAGWSRGRALRRPRATNLGHLPSPHGHFPSKITVADICPAPYLTLTLI